jgi:hypothetical protein
VLGSRAAAPGSQVVTVIMKTFQRQTVARGRSPAALLPEIRLLIVDDSREALAFSHPQAEVVRPLDRRFRRTQRPARRVATEYFR